MAHSAKAGVAKFPAYSLRARAAGPPKATQFDPSVVKAFERVYPHWVAELVCFRAESA